MATPINKTIPFKLVTFHACNSRNISTFVMIKTALYELKRLLLYVTILPWACHMILSIVKKIVDEQQYDVLNGNPLNEIT